MEYSVKYEKNPDPKLTEILYKRLGEYAHEQKSLDAIENFGFFIYDEKNDLKAGCNGIMYYGCIHIDQLWVDKSCRGHGLGSKLMKHAELLGREKNCHFSSVTTMDWEALNFYIKLGYHIEFERTGYAKDSSFYMLRKDFEYI